MSTHHLGYIHAAVSKTITPYEIEKNGEGRDEEKKKKLNLSRT